MNKVQMKDVYRILKRRDKNERLFFISVKMYLLVHWNSSHLTTVSTIVTVTLDTPSVHVLG